MSTLANIIVTVQVNTSGLQQSLQGAQNQIKTTTDSLQELGSQLKTLGYDMTRVGGTLTAAITAPLLGLAETSTKAFNDYELNIKRVTSLMGDMADKFEGQYYDAVRKLAVEMGVDAVKAAQGLYDVISADIPPENAISFLTVSTKAAIAGLTDVQTAASAIRIVIKAYQLDTSEAANVSDVLFQAVNKGIFTFGQLAAAMGQAMPIASELGISYKEVAAAGASLSQLGLTAGQSFTYLKQAMNSLLKPSTDLKALFHDLGVASGQELLQKFGGLVPALQALRDAAGGSDAVLSKAMGRIQGFQALLGLTGTNLMRTTEFITEMNNSLGATDGAYNKINESASRTFDKLNSAWNDLKITIGEALAPFAKTLTTMLLDLIPKIKELAQDFKSLPETTKDWIIGLAAAAAVIGPILTVAGLMTSGFGALADGFAKLAELFGGVTEGATGAGAAISDLFLPALVILAAAFATFKDAQMLGDWTGMRDIFKTLGDAAMALGATLKDGLGAAWAILKGAMLPVAETAKLVWDIFHSLFQLLSTDLLQAIKDVGNAFNDVRVVFEAATQFQINQFKQLELGLQAFADKYPNLTANIKAAATSATLFASGIGILVSIINAAVSSSVWGKLTGYFSSFTADFIKGSRDIQQEINNAQTMAAGAAANIAKDTAATNAALVQQVQARDKAIQNSAAYIKAEGDVATGVTTATTKMTAAQKAFATVNTEVENDLRSLPANYNEFLNKIGAGSAVLDALPATWRKADQAILDVQQEIDKVGQKYINLGQSGSEELDKLNQRLADMRDEADRFKTEDMAKSFEDMDNAMGKIVPKMVDLKTSAADWKVAMSSVNDELTKSGQNLDVIDKAFAENGLKTTAYYQKRVDDAKAAMDALNNMTDQELAHYNYSIADRTQAWVAYETARQEAARKSGEVVSQDEVNTLNAVRVSLGDTTVNVNKSAEAWTNLGKEMKSAIAGLSDGLANAIVKGGSFGQVMINSLQAVESAILKFVIKGALTELVKSLGLANGSFDTLWQKFGAFFGTGGADAVTALNSAGKAAANAASIAQQAATAAAKTADQVSSTSQSLGKAASSMNQTAATALSAFQQFAQVFNLITGAINAVVGILNLVQSFHLEKLVGEIEVTTRGILNEALNLRRDGWTWNDNIMVKFGQLYDEIHAAVWDGSGGIIFWLATINSTIGAVGASGGGGKGTSTGSGGPTSGDTSGGSTTGGGVTDTGTSGASTAAADTSSSLSGVSNALSDVSNAAADTTAAVSNASQQITTFSGSWASLADYFAAVEKDPNLLPHTGLGTAMQSLPGGNNQDTYQGTPTYITDMNGNLERLVAKVGDQLTYTTDAWGYMNGPKGPSTAIVAAGNMIQAQLGSTNDTFQGVARTMTDVNGNLEQLVSVLDGVATYTNDPTGYAAMLAAGHSGATATTYSPYNYGDNAANQPLGFNQPNLQFGQFQGTSGQVYNNGAPSNTLNVNVTANNADAKTLAGEIVQTIRSSGLPL